MTATIQNVRLPRDWAWDRSIHGFASLRDNVHRFFARQPGSLPTQAILGELDRHRTAWPRDLVDAQRPDGWFEDALRRLTLQGHALDPTVKTLIGQRDRLADCVHLRTPPRHPQRFLEPFLRDPAIVGRWLDSQPWDNPWLVGNADMDTAWCLATEWKLQGDERAFEALEVWFDWHDARVDAATGFWDPARTGHLRHVMAGAMHQLALYFLFGREVKHPEAIVRATLSLQEPTGLFCDRHHSHNCLDIDAVFLLVNLCRRYGVLEREVRSALERALEASLRCFLPEGGAVSRAGVDRKPDWWSTWCRVAVVGWSARLVGATAFDGPWDFRPRHPFQSEDGGASLPDWRDDAWYDAADWPRPHRRG